MTGMRRLVKLSTKKGYIERARDVYLQVNPTDKDVTQLAEILEKADKYDVLMLESCSECGGTGSISGEAWDCPKCEGRGRVKS